MEHQNTQSTESGKTMVEERENAQAKEVENIPEEGKEDWEKKYKELYDQYVRLAADFDNVRKRGLQEQEALRKYGAESALHEIIPVLDNLERAGSSLSESSDPKLLFQSFRLLQNQLLEALGAIGMQKLEAVGQVFDPNFHEAITQIENNEHPEDTIIQELQSGFMYKDRLLRPARVAVSVKGSGEKKPENPFQSSTTGDNISSSK